MQRHLCREPVLWNECYPNPYCLQTCMWISADHRFFQQRRWANNYWCPLNAVFSRGSVWQTQSYHPATPLQPRMPLPPSPPSSIPTTNQSQSSSSWKSSTNSAAPIWKLGSWVGFWHSWLFFIWWHCFWWWRLMPNFEQRRSFASTQTPSVAASPVALNGFLIQDLSCTVMRETPRCPFRCQSWICF